MYCAIIKYSSSLFVFYLLCEQWVNSLNQFPILGEISSIDVRSLLLLIFVNQSFSCVK